MKIYFAILLIGLFGQQLKAQDQKPNEFNGWKFLEWKTEKKTAEKMISNKGIEIKNDYSEPAYSKITRFVYDEMNVRLYFDSMFQLSYVEQQKEFSIVQLDEANDFFGKIKKSLIQEYGKPNVETNNKSEKIINMIWNYKYKIIDEFGCCSYKVTVYISPFGHSDTLTYAIIPYDNSYNWIFRNRTQTKLTTRDLVSIEQILNRMINNYNLVLQPKKNDRIELNNYKRQYIAVVNNKGQKEVWVNCFCKNWTGGWKEEIILVKDGGNCYFNL
ncbi:MAG: hypothetical protein ABIJ97_01520 [Bacteroidota bacterium]